MGLNGVLGIIVPISDETAMHDVFHGQSLHVDPSGDVASDLERGDRIFFYDSGRTHKLIGEAAIASVAFGEAKDVLEEERGRSHHHHDIHGLERLASSVPEGGSARLRVIRFENSTVYAAPVKCTVAIPEGGLYLTAEISARIRRDNA